MVKISLLILIFVVTTCRCCFNSGCECNKFGSSNQDCDSDENCDCKPNVTGPKCDQCISGRFGFPDCLGRCQHGQECRLATFGVLGKGWPYKIVDIFGENSQVLEQEVEPNRPTFLKAGNLQDHCLICINNLRECFKLDRYHQLERLQMIDNSNQNRRRVDKVVQGPGVMYSVSYYSVSQITSLNNGWVTLLDNPISNPVKHIQCATYLDEKTLVALGYDEGY